MAKAVYTMLLYELVPTPLLKIIIHKAHTRAKNKADGRAEDRLSLCRNKEREESRLRIYLVLCVCVRYIITIVGRSLSEISVAIMPIVWA